MSKYGWEKGGIVVPSSEWAGLKKKIRETDAAMKERSFALAVEIHAHLSALPAAERRKDLSSRAYSFLEAKLGRRAFEDEKGVDERRRAVYAVCTSSYDAATRSVTHSIRRPKKADFAPAGNNVLVFETSDCTIEFDNETRTVHWTVNENNHAVEHARASPIGSALFQAFRTMVWTRGTGGVLEGNDEYHREAGEEDRFGGGSYVTDRIGPVGKQDLDDTMAGYQAMAKASMGRTGR